MHQDKIRRPTAGIQKKKMDAFRAAPGKKRLYTEDQNGSELPVYWNDSSIPYGMPAYVHEGSVPYNRDGISAPLGVTFGNAAPVQLAKTDKKKERWKRQGRKNWKHGRKLAAHRKLEVDDEPVEEEPVAIVSQIFRENDFDELSYLSAEEILIGLYYDRPCVRDIIDKMRKERLEKFIQENVGEILKQDGVRELVCSAGSCGDLANYLFPKLEVDGGPAEKEPAVMTSQIFRENDFDELSYLSAEEILIRLYYDEVDSRVRDIIDEMRENMEPLDKFIQENVGEILEQDGVRELSCSTGACGDLANYLFPQKIDMSKNVGQFSKFIDELQSNVRKGEVKLIRANANIGHAFTLICYRQKDRVVVELIQAWLGEYSVKDSLNAKNVFWKETLITAFKKMNSSLQDAEGMRCFREIFLLTNPRRNNLEINFFNVKVLKKGPEEYARELSGGDV